MDTEILAVNIAQLSSETIECVKMIERGTEIFLFDDETSEDLEKFLKIVKIKALRIANPRDKKDITKNIKRKHVYENWQTTDWFNNLCDNQQEL